MSSDSGAGRAEHVIVAPHLQPYPAYKLSGLEWLANIPAHWRTERGKWLLKKMKRPVRDTDEVVTCFRDGVVTLRKNRRTEGFTESLQEIGYQGIREGDLVIHAMDAFAGAIGVADSDGKGTPVYSVCRPDPNDNAYYFAYILSTTTALLLAEDRKSKKRRRSDRIWAVHAVPWLFKMRFRTLIFSGKLQIR